MFAQLSLGSRGKLLGYSRVIASQPALSSGTRPSSESIFRREMRGADNDLRGVRRRRGRLPDVPAARRGRVPRLPLLIWCFPVIIIITSSAFRGSYIIL